MRGERTGRGVAPGWLETRLREVPPDLAVAIRELAVPDPEEFDAGLAGRTALAALVRVAERSDGKGPPARDLALDLLAADALLTYAFEGAADRELNGSAAGAAALALRLGPRGDLGRHAATGRW